MIDLPTWLSQCCTTVSDATTADPASLIAETYLADQRSGNCNAVLQVIEQLREMGLALANGSSLLKLGGALPIHAVGGQRIARPVGDTFDERLLAYLAILPAGPHDVDEFVAGYLEFHRLPITDESRISTYKALRNRQQVVGNVVMV